MSTATDVDTRPVWAAGDMAFELHSIRRFTNGPTGELWVHGQWSVLGSDVQFPLRVSFHEIAWGWLT